jgi:hypothetical protein
MAEDTTPKVEIEQKEGDVVTRDYDRPELYDFWAQGQAGLPPVTRAAQRNLVGFWLMF